jgi:hypothetical protein
VYTDFIMNHAIASRSYSVMNFSLQLRYVDESDETWVAVPDAAYLLGYANAGSFVGSTDKKKAVLLDGEEVMMVPFSFFAKAAINSEKPQARAVGNLMLRYLAAGLKINSVPSDDTGMVTELPRSSTRYGPQPILDVMRQRGISRQRAFREMNDIQLDGVPRLATTVEGQFMGSMPVQDVTVVRASAWLKLPLNQLFTSWRQGDQRFTGLATFLDKEIIKRYVTASELSDGRMMALSTAVYRDGSTADDVFVDGKKASGQAETVFTWE